MKLRCLGASGPVLRISLLYTNSSIGSIICILIKLVRVAHDLSILFIVLIIFSSVACFLFLKDLSL